MFFFYANEFSANLQPVKITSGDFDLHQGLENPGVLVEKPNPVGFWVFCGFLKILGQVELEFIKLYIGEKLI